MSGVQSPERRVSELLRLRKQIDDELSRLANLTGTQRTKRSKFEVPECGSESAYQRHRYYGEPQDTACQRAHNEHNRDQYEIAKARRLARRLEVAS